MSSEILLFTNWTKESFTGYWDGVPETFKPGQSKYMEGWRARHYAKHLTDRELNRKKLATNGPERAAIFAKAISNPNEEIDQNDLIDLGVKDEKPAGKKEAAKSDSKSAKKPADEKSDDDDEAGDFKGVE